MLNAYIPFTMNILEVAEQSSKYILPNIDA